ncbi:N-6 DNA methylase [Planktothricoides sp. SR001]|uniref:Eco57I restriction-modification methylase domain-containing protein n=1 Tax=Planktothricoides sp. SR001 TaxID=1705388 RepID=UPI0006C5A424|nr:DNA methyltransferase [Planktothricoides sp. SR001]KOR34637.1 N-6 DNA methylase [Planktothricoides sp. SR001]
MNIDRTLFEHKEWLGLLQPIGLVVAPPALIKAQANIDRGKLIELQQKFKEYLAPEPLPNGEPWISDLLEMGKQVLEWPEKVIVRELPAELSVFLRDYGEILQADYALKNREGNEWLFLIKIVSPGTDLDRAETEKPGQGWKASPQAKFERLLRETQNPIGLLCNGTEIRLIYAPRGESSGYLTFPVKAMTEVAGRLILGALEMLLGKSRLYTVPAKDRLPQILANSRQYQAEVSTQLSAQVLDALWELLRGMQTADAAVQGQLLKELRQNPEGKTHIYGGLITILMRLVFLLYAEDEGLMPDEPVYQRYYAVSGLYEKLRNDAGQYPDTMDLRYGAYAGLLSLFRLVYDGGGPYEDYLPARHGQLFDPDVYGFLEGRPEGSKFKDIQEPLNIPQIPDGVIYRILDKLVMLNGDRLSYRSLDVEDIGSVYEGIMGFEVQTAPDLSIALSPQDIVINVAELLAAKPGDRAKLLKDWAECSLPTKGATELKQAKTIEDILAALGRRISDRTHNLLPKGSLYLQPGEERRKSGSHYTPRALTGPIVANTLKPILAQFGSNPTAEQILSLKICDPAMGSGAFLVEVCRQLAELLVVADATETGFLKETRFLSTTQIPIIQARRKIAQRCLYGVDKNPFAVNLAKLSLWLVTLAKDAPFTFVDHALKCGDSLVGLTTKEIGAFVDPTADLPLSKLLNNQVRESEDFRLQIQATDTQTDADAEANAERWNQSESALENARFAAWAKVAAFFDGASKNKSEKAEIEEKYRLLVENSLSGDGDARNRVFSKNPVSTSNEVSIPTPFNWEVEFPEVFNRPNPGFDCIVGNPPFAGKNTIINGNPEGYVDWLKEVHPESHGNADLVAHFFRRSFNLIRDYGTLGLIATNTISQGDTRSSGLRFICNHGGMIYHATQRYRWPGMAAVVVSLVHIFKGGKNIGVGTGAPPLQLPQPILDGRPVNKITAFLFNDGGNDDPKPLLANAEKSFQGSIVLGMGFTFDDSNADATPIAEMHRLIAANPQNQEVIFPYIGGSEVNSSPTHAHHRYVINFGEMSEQEAREGYPDLMQIVEAKVKPERAKLTRNAIGRKRADFWWQYGSAAKELYKAIAPLSRVLVIACAATKYLGFAFLPSNMVFSHKLVVFPLDKFSQFTVMQSRIHEIWSIFFSATLEDRLTYNPTDCFETFPFPENWETDANLEQIGQTYYETRAQLMIENNQGLTDTYNRFHDPNETDPEILQLRELHEQMDLAVLSAYGWSDPTPECGFALDYLDTDPDHSYPPDIQDRIDSHDLFFPTADAALEFANAVQTGKRKLPWRRRWDEPTHNDILARLLQLNQERYDAEIRLGKHSQGKKKQTKPPSKPKKEVNSDQLNLL